MKLYTKLKKLLEFSSIQETAAGLGVPYGTALKLQTGHAGRGMTATTERLIEALEMLPKNKRKQFLAVLKKID